jgi:hypothetical protein
MKYAHLDENNKLLGWYSLEVHQEIPEPNIEVTEEDWQAALHINANFYDGLTFIYRADLDPATQIQPEVLTKEDLMAKLLEIQSQLETM